VHTAKDLTVARPMRKPVKLPGPDAAAKKSMSFNFTPAVRSSLSTFSSKSVECEDDAFPANDDRVFSPRATLMLPARVAVSMAKMSGTSFLDIAAQYRAFIHRLTGASAGAMILNHTNVLGAIRAEALVRSL